MPRFRVVHRDTGETWEVEASGADLAREIVGWPKDVCEAILLLKGPFASIEPPNIAKQISPPAPGSSHICPECKVSLIEASVQGEFWWQCPSCDLLYQEWDNRYYRADEL
jgi:hypothetical protein